MQLETILEQKNHFIASIKPHYIQQCHLMPTYHMIQVLAYLSDGEHDISGGDQRVQGACQFIAHHLRQHHGDGLSQHHSLSLNTSNTCIYIQYFYKSRILCTFHN